MITAAIYARKSTEQHSADAEAKSVARQIENARAFAKSKGWKVHADHVYADDAISGAEVRKLKSRQRLLDVIASGQPPFQAIIVRDASRFSRRDGEEAFAELKRIAQSGVQIWFYQDSSRFAFGTFGDNVVGFVRAEMNAEYRRQIARFVTEAMMRKAQSGHFTGGRCFGYDNVKVNGHTEQRINPAQAATIRRIFELSASGMGYTRIAKQLNADGALTPTPWNPGQVKAWSSDTVKKALHRPLYRGEVIYNRTRCSAPDGSSAHIDRPESEWLRIDRPDLRIISPELWQAAHTRLTAVRSSFATPSSAAPRRHRRDAESQYLLSGFVRCAECGTSISVLDRRVYGCLAYHKRGTTVCRNGVRLPIDRLDAAIRQELTARALRPKMADAIVSGVLAELARVTNAQDVSKQRRELAALDAEIARLTDALASGGQMAALLDGLRARQAKRDALAQQIAAAAAVDTTRVNRAKIERRAHELFAEWRAAVQGPVGRARQVLRQILPTPLVLTPQGRTFRFEGELAVGQAICGVIGLPTNHPAPERRTKGCTMPLRGVAA